jgi:hypothetical protein
LWKASISGFCLVVLATKTPQLIHNEMPNLNGNLEGGESLQLYGYPLKIVLAPFVCAAIPT